jgi:hypothetical protein
MAATRRRPRWRLGARAAPVAARGAVVGAAAGDAVALVAAERLAAVGAVATAGAVPRARFVAICEGILYYPFCEGTLA